MTPPVRLRTGESSRPVILGFGTRRIWRGLLRVRCAVGTWGGRSSDRPAVDDSTVGGLSELSADGSSLVIGAASLPNRHRHDGYRTCRVVPGTAADRCRRHGT